MVMPGANRRRTAPFDRPFLVTTLPDHFLPNAVKGEGVTGSGTIPFLLSGAMFPAGVGGVTIDQVGGGDITSRITWPAADVTVVEFDGVLPDDIDVTVAASLVTQASMSGATDTPVLTEVVMAGLASANLGSATSALNAVATTNKTIAINLAGKAPGNKIAVTITPGAHGTDAVWLDKMYLVYTRL